MHIHRVRIGSRLAVLLCCLLAVAESPATEGGDEPRSPWRYRYRDREVELRLDPERAVVLLDAAGRRDPLAALGRVADPELHLPPGPEDLLEYPGLASLRFRAEVPAAERLAAIRRLAGARGLELASAPFVAGEALLIPRAEVWVVLEPGTAHETLARILLERDLAPLAAHRALSPTWLLSFAGSPLDAFERARSLAAIDGVVHAQPNFIRKLVEHGVPNDTLFPSQWSLSNTGQYGGTPGSDLGAIAAWDITTGASDVEIAIIDEGVDVAHPDLAPNLLPGHDSVTAAPTPGGIPGNAAQSDAHGTACAGIAAARGDNSLGVAGVCWNAGIRPVRVGFGSFWTQDDWVVDGITWAADQGADVISCSWGGGPPSTIEQGAIAYATTLGRGGLGAVVFGSSGNADVGTVAYPAAYPEAIAVGASSNCDERKSASSCDGEWWWGSQWGPGLDLVAPGPKVATTDISGAGGYAAGDYFEFSGTSSACPLAAGATALLLSIEPQRTVADVRQLLAASARDLVGDPAEDVPGWDPYMGWGRLDLLGLLVSSGAVLAPPYALTCAADGADADLAWTNGAAYDSIIVTRDGAVIATLAGTATAAIDPAPGVGLFRYEVRGVAGGQQSPRTACSALVVGAATDLVWSPVQGAFDGGIAIAEGLLSLGRHPLLVDSLAAAGSLESYETVWVNLGIFPAKHVLTAAEGSALAAYLLGSAGDRALYLEGGDTWFFDPPTAVHPLFGIVPLSDGSSQGELSSIVGGSGSGCDLSDLAYSYVGENQWIDRIAPALGSSGVLANVAPSFQVMVFRDSGGYRTAGASFELAGLANGLDTRTDLVAGILDCWQVPYIDDPSPTAPLSLLCQTIQGSVQLTWTLGDNYDELRIRRDSVLIATLAGSATGFLDPSPAAGLNAYEVIGRAAGHDSAPAACIVPIATPLNNLRVSDEVAAIGEIVVFDVTADHVLPLEGYVFALTFDPQAVAINALTIDGTWFETLSADFFAPAVDNSTGIATVTAMIDASPPITEAVPPGYDHLILRVDAYVLPTSPFSGATTIGLPEMIGDPPLAATFIENGGTAYPPTRIPGTLMIVPNSVLRLRIPALQGPAGSPIAHTVVVDTDRELTGISFGIEFDATALEFVSGGVAGTVAEGADFVAIEVDPVAGELTARSILDLDSPAALWIEPGLARPVLALVWEADASLATGTQIDLAFAAGLGSPPVPIAVTDLSGVSFAPQTVDGSITVGVAIGPQFRRGDANFDGEITLADPITVLAGLFAGGSIPCADAADANDDGYFDVADPVYLLSYLFVGGPEPPPPFPGWGADPTSDPLGCT